MLRGCPTSADFYSVAPILALALLIVLTLKVIRTLNVITSQPNILPKDVKDLEAAGVSTAIARSPSDSTLAKRYMSAREPPVTGYRSQPPTPTPSSELSFASGQEEAFRLPVLDSRPPLQPQLV